MGVGRGRGVLGVLMIGLTEDQMFLGNVAVAPGHQGRGLGRELVTFAEGQAVAYGLPEVRLYANVHFRRTSLSSVGSRDDQDRFRRGPQYTTGQPDNSDMVDPEDVINMLMAEQ